MPVINASEDLSRPQRLDRGPGQRKTRGDGVPPRRLVPYRQRKDNEEVFASPHAATWWRSASTIASACSAICISPRLGGEHYADSGNAGTLDQILALRWIKDNIGRFGERSRLRHGLRLFRRRKQDIGPACHPRRGGTVPPRQRPERDPAATPPSPSSPRSRPGRPWRAWSARSEGRRQAPRAFRRSAHDRRGSRHTRQQPVARATARRTLPVLPGQGRARHARRHVQARTQGLRPYSSNVIGTAKEQNSR